MRDWQKISTIAQVVKVVLTDCGRWIYQHHVGLGSEAGCGCNTLRRMPLAAIGEFFRDNKRHAGTFYDDDLPSTAGHRENSLLCGDRRDAKAYPGDVVYLHSRLLERAAKLNDKRRRLAELRCR